MRWGRRYDTAEARALRSEAEAVAYCAAHATLSHAALSRAGREAVGMCVCACVRAARRACARRGLKQLTRGRDS